MRQALRVVVAVVATRNQRVFQAQLAAVPRYVQMGVPSFKIFMNNRGGEGKRLGLPDIDDGFLFRLCETAAEHGGPAEVMAQVMAHVHGQEIEQLNAPPLHRRASGPSRSTIRRTTR